jgi:DNA-binding transcriptional LysR family regulator
MLKLESLLAFVTTADAGSISEAARRLQISKSVASERIAELERQVGSTLLLRSTRGLSLTEDGLALLDRARRILRDVDAATTELSERRGELSGALRVSAPVSFGVLHLASAITSFLKAHPHIELALELDDRFVSPTDGFDAIVRHGPVLENGWTVKQFAASRRMLVASPRYVKQRGVPRTISDLEQHSGIIYSNRGASDWRFRQGGRWIVAVPATIFRVNNGIVMRSAALDGLGIALLPTFFFHEQLSARKLQVLDVGAEAEPASLFIAYPNARRVSAKVLALIDHLQKSFGDPPRWEQRIP